MRIMITRLTGIFFFFFLLVVSVHGSCTDSGAIYTFQQLLADGSLLLEQPEGYIKK